MQKVALITGASRGIGRATAKLFAENGYAVIINYNKSARDADDLETQLKLNGCNAVALHADVSDQAQVDTMVARAITMFGHIDVLINNAGTDVYKLFDQTTEAEWSAVFDVNAKGAFLCSRAVFPNMLERKSGRIINISSVWGEVGGSMEVAYSASKAAIIGFTKALADELAPSGITVNCIAPGMIETDMNARFTADETEAIRQSIPLGRIGKPLDVAKAALFFASDGADYITGQTLSVGGGYRG